jgi:hypothetical protein
VGTWLGRLLPRLERTVVMFTRQPDRPFPSLSAEANGRFFQLDVPDFSADDVKRYLERPTRRISDDLARRVHVITGGHPGTVSLVHDILWEAGLDDGGREAALNEITSETTERVAHLAERLVQGQNDPRLSNALWAAALPRRFDASLLKALLDETEVPAREVPEVFERLGHLPFVEDVTAPGEGPKRSWLRVHAYVRPELLDRMVRLDRDRFGRLHDRAATFHNQALLGITSHEPAPEGANSKDGGDSALDSPAPSFQYGEAFVYENPDWQRHRREWLYHRMHAQNDGQRRQALLECTRVFLDAFWWWGNYVHFDFCDQLVADLDHMVRHRSLPGGIPSWADLKNLHQGLHDLLEAYPPRSGKKDGDWPRVYNALLQIQDACAIPSTKALNGEQRKVRALLEIFIAHTWRYRDPHSQRAANDYRQAQNYYQRAQDDLEQLKESWSIPWVLFERADLRLERDEADDELRRLWLEAAAIVQPPATSDGAGDEGDAETDGGPDEELTANLHRLRGDLCWQAGEHLRAAGWYRRAVLHAYLFHNAGDHPDEYTLQFYVDIRARALNRLLSLVADGDHDGALRCAIELANVHADTGEDVPDPAELQRQLSTHADGGLADLEPVPLALTLFPVGPQVEELVSESTPFKREFLRRAEAVDRDAIACDLSDEQWP